ncbi:hypothetical protein Pst134EA_009627 [Puccinia striiformis f. sp. tritici]|uniref:hypothetical protein n=1 Tax=Puccinia striiformis f. sp. tritici TaxID=168172 RepID=UPI0020077419|nr:hypothetical protein Pst134EA_009627 [Puccinia striiformis f. sp. tritici]KAH9469102.1 hypothetical protein Pst134EA_009627 [Puccinia striiformis f. sp. tritici]
MDFRLGCVPSSMCQVQSPDKAIHSRYFSCFFCARSSHHPELKTSEASGQLRGGEKTLPSARASWLSEPIGSRFRPSSSEMAGMTLGTSLPRIRFLLRQPVSEHYEHNLLPLPGKASAIGFFAQR